MWRVTVVRGLSECRTTPLGREAAPNICFVTPRNQVSRLLRSRTGASPLATMMCQVTNSNIHCEVSTDENPRHLLPAPGPRRLQLAAVLPRARPAIHPGQSQARISRRHPDHRLWPEAARLVATGGKRRRSQRYGAAPAWQWRQPFLPLGRQLVVTERGLPSVAGGLPRLWLVRRQTVAAGDLSGHRRRVQMARPGARGQGQAVDRSGSEPRRLDGRALPGPTPGTSAPAQGLGPRWRARQLPGCRSICPDYLVADLAISGAVVVAGAGR